MFTFLKRQDHAGLAVRWLPMLSVLHGLSSE
jgi:hypothetical protein